MLNNWMLNTRGLPNSFVEVDLVQEHMNFWIKVCVSVALILTCSDIDYRDSTKLTAATRHGNGSPW